MSEKIFKFNPFKIKDWTEEEVTDQFEILEEDLMHDDTPMAVSHDIECYANMGYLIGEMIARYTEIVDELDITLKNNISNTIYRERDQWKKQESEKTPSIEYFKNKATSMFYKEALILSLKEANLKRFKYAYESIEHKQNALKKRLESMRLDLSNR